MSRPKIEGIVSGGARTIRLVLKSLITGGPVDLTGASVFFFVKLLENDAGELIWVKVIDHVDAAQGITDIALTQEQTATLDPGVDHVAQIRVKFDDGSDEVSQVMTINPEPLLSSREVA
jgi:hypothetical protein